MKKLYLLFLVGLFSTSVFSQWLPQNTGITNNLRGVFVLNENIGFAVGEAFAPNFAPILKTTDGGAHWVMKSSGTLYPLRDIAFNNNIKGFACGLYGTLLKSTDAGDTWGTVDLSTTAGFRAIDFPSKEVGYVAGEAGIFLKTSNIGVTWDSLNTGVTQDLLDIEFLNNDTGYATGSTGFSNGIIIRTLDGGNSWQTVYTSTQAIPAVAVTEDNKIFAGGGTSPNGGHEFIVRSLDGGDTWEEVFTGVPGYSIRRGTFSSPIAGWFVDDAGSVIRTKNGGLTWTINSLSTGGLNGIFFTEKDTGYAVGAQGSIFKYTPCSDTLVPLGSIVGETTICFGTTTTYSISPVNGANTYEWQVPQDASLVFSQGDTLVAVTFGSMSGNVSVIAGADCDTSIAVMPVFVIPPLQAAGSISGTSNFCYGDTVIYTLSPIPNAINYEWTVSADAEILAQNDTMVLVAFGTSSGTIEMTATDLCDTLKLMLPVTAHTSLAPISPITGDNAVCLESLASYQISAVQDAFSYDWTLPQGASIVYSSGDTLVVVQFDSTSGNVGVTANGYCDSVSALLAVEVVGNFLSIDTIYGPVTACQGVSVDFHITPVPSATSYVWNVPDDATILSIQNDTIVSVAFGATSGLVSITVSKENCDAAVASLFVDVTPSLQDPEDVIGVTLLCSGDSASFIVSSVTGADSYSWQVPEGSSIISTTGDTLINVIFGDSSGYIIFSASSICETVTSSVYVTVHPGVPPIQSIIGETLVCSGDTVTYSIASVPGVDYSWNVPSDATIISSLGDTVISVRFGNSSALITVIAGSACAFQDTFLAVFVQTFSPIPGIMGDVQVCGGDTATYSINSAEGLEYSWIIPTGATIVASQGDTSITVQFGNESGVITALATSSCGIQDTTLNVTVLSVAPIPPIVGADVVCSGDTATYSINSMDGFDYSWTVPSGSIILEQGDTSISVVFGSISGNISVYTSNECNTQDTTLAITVVSVAPIDEITGTAQVCSGDTATYSINSAPGVTFTWTIPEEASILSSTADTSITILFGSMSGNVSVTGQSSCNTQNVVLYVEVVAYPPVPFILFIDNSLVSSAPSGNQWYYESNPISGATSQIFIPTLNGTYSVTVTYPPGCSTSSDTLNVISIGIRPIVAFTTAVVSPNPFESFTTVQLTNNYQLRDGSLLIQDMQGKLVLRLDHLNGNTVKIFRDALPEGIYFFKLSDELHGLISTGKLVIQ